MIYLVRHGQTQFNAERRYQGACDSPLTALGQSQARDIGARLAAVAPAHSRLVASPLGRTQHTARLIREAAGLAAPLETDPRLAEISMGSWDGRNREEITEISPDFPAIAMLPDWYMRSPDGETHDALAARLRSWLDEALAHGGPIIAVSHGVSGTVLRGLYLGLTGEQALNSQPVPQDSFFRLADGRVERFDAEAAG
jgi:probable phosphoglycerate mutase